MGAEPVVVLHVFGQDRLQVPSTHDQQPVQALAPGTGDPALAPSVRVWGPHRRSDDLQTLCPEDGIEGGREVAVTIVDQEAGLDLSLLQFPGQISRLLDGPATARVFATGGEDDAPAGQLQEEENVQALEEHGVHREVVAGQDRLAVGLQETAPGESCSSRRGWDAVAAEQVADAGGGDPMAELEQFAANAHVAPKWVLPRQPQHQLLALGRQRRPSGTAAAAE